MGGKVQEQLQDTCSHLNREVIHTGKRMILNPGMSIDISNGCVAKSWWGIKFGTLVVHLRNSQILFAYVHVRTVIHINQVVARKFRNSIHMWHICDVPC